MGNRTRRKCEWREKQNGGRRNGGVTGKWKRSRTKLTKAAKIKAEYSE